MSRGRVLLLIVLTFIVGVIVGIFIGPRLFIAGGDNLILNGSFEQSGQYVSTPDEPILSDACKVLCGGSSALESWQVFRQPVEGSQSCTNAKDAACWGKPSGTMHAQDGAFTVDLTGEAGRPPRQFGQVQQSVENTQPGQTYELSFAVGSSRRFPPPQGTRIGIFVTVVGVQDLFVEAIQTDEPSHWDLRSFRFKAADRLTTIRFSGSEEPLITGNGGDFLGLDNVVLRKVCFIVNAVLFGCKI